MNADEHRLMPLKKAGVVGQRIVAVALERCTTEDGWLAHAIAYVQLGNGKILCLNTGSLHESDSWPDDAMPISISTAIKYRVVSKVHVDQDYPDGNIVLELENGRCVYVVPSAPAETGGAGICVQTMRI